MKKKGGKRCGFCRLAIVLLNFALLICLASPAVGATSPETDPAVTTEAGEASPDYSGFLGEIQQMLDGISQSLSDLWDSIYSAVKDATFGAFLNVREFVVRAIWQFLSPFLGEAGLQMLIRDGGFQFASDALNRTISALYNIFFPIGMGIMLVSWIYSIAKGGIDSSLDISMKNSIARAALNIVIGLIAMSVAPQMMMVLSSMSFSLCRSITENLRIEPGWMDNIPDVNAVVTLNTQLISAVLWWLGYALITIVLQAVYLVNILKMALLQAVSPLFVGLTGGSEGTRRVFIGMFKSYLKCCLIPPISAAYVLLATTAFDGLLNPILVIVAAFSIFSIAGKLLDRILS